MGRKPAVDDEVDRAPGHMENRDVLALRNLKHDEFRTGVGEVFDVVPKSTGVARSKNLETSVQNC